MKPINNATTKFPKKKLKIANRMECMDEPRAYITFKEHKENYPEMPSFRLINPSKSHIGKS